MLLMVGGLLAGAQTPAQSAAPEAGYSASALYNLANSYAREGKPGMAVLNFQRAGLLAPNDADIADNLRLVRESARVSAEPASRFERNVSIAGPSVLAWIGVAGVLLIGLGVLAGKFISGRRWARAGCVTAGLLMIALTVCNGIVVWPKLHAGVVIVAASPVRVSPVPMGDPLFTLPEAETVIMRAEHEGFVFVQTRAGKSGWIARANLASVVPGKP
jgi:hypothetical protein